MGKVLLHILLGVSLFVLSGCSNYYSEVAKSIENQRQKKLKFHAGLYDIPAKPLNRDSAYPLKKNKLSGYPQKTIGEAFDSYDKHARKIWTERLGGDGRMYVDFTCWFNDVGFIPALKGVGVGRSGFNLKFVVKEDGDTYITLAEKLFMKTSGEIDSEVIPFSELPKIVSAIYNNKDLHF